MRISGRGVGFVEAGNPAATHLWTRRWREDAEGMIPGSETITVERIGGEHG